MMNDKILEILLDMQKELKEVNKKIDILNYKMNDGFETLELLSENNSNEISKLKVKVSKLENRLKEMNNVN